VGHRLHQARRDVRDRGHLHLWLAANAKASAHLIRADTLEDSAAGGSGDAADDDADDALFDIGEEEAAAEAAAADSDLTVADFGVSLPRRRAAEAAGRLPAAPGPADTPPPAPAAAAAEPQAGVDGGGGRGWGAGASGRA
jgi:hypothetical protein